MADEPEAAGVGASAGAGAGSAAAAEPAAATAAVSNENENEDDDDDDDDDEAFLDVPQVNREMLLIPPLNFSLVSSGIYRSGYPNRRNFGFLEHIGIRCMVCLSAEEPSEVEIGKQNKAFIVEKGIRMVRFPIEGQKEPFSMTSAAAIRDALRQVLDARNHPVLIHCDKGKHRTGTVVGCLRKLEGWALSSIFDEYARFCKKSTRVMDHQLIEFFAMTFSDDEQAHLPRSIRQVE